MHQLLTTPHGRRPQQDRLLSTRSCGWAVIFLAVLLLSRGGAAPATQDAAFDAQLRVSNYRPTASRDPFLPAQARIKAATSTVAQTEFRLQGLLYDSTRPAAIVNDEMLILNKPKKLLTVRGEVEVTAVEINRQHVVLEVGGARIELPFDTAGR